MLKSKNLLRLALAESRTPADFALTSPPEAPWTFRVGDHSIGARNTKVCRAKTIHDEPSVQLQNIAYPRPRRLRAWLPQPVRYLTWSKSPGFPTAFETRLLGAINAEQGQTSLCRPWSWSLADGYGRLGAGKNCTGHGSTKINI